MQALEKAIAEGREYLETSWNSYSKTKDYRNEHYRECAQEIKPGFSEPKRSSEQQVNVPSSSHPASPRSSEMEILCYTSTLEDPESSYHTEGVSETTPEAYGEAEEGFEPSEYDDSDSEESEPSQGAGLPLLETPLSSRTETYGVSKPSSPDYEAGEMPADANKDSEESSDTSLELTNGAPQSTGLRFLETPLSSRTETYGVSSFSSPDNEAGEMPANANEDSEESSDTFLELVNGAPVPVDCNEPLSEGTKQRLHVEASILWRRGYRLLQNIMLPAFDSIARRQLRMAIGHQNGVG